MSEIRDNLSEATAGMVCLTRENLTEPWILYEAGALSTKAVDRLWTVLLDLPHTDVPDPLKALNHTKAEKADVLKMVGSIHKTVVAAGFKTCAESDLKDYFEAFWPELERAITQLQAQDPVPTAQPDPQQEMLGIVRAILQRVSQDRWREEKMLAMLHIIYSVTVGAAAPSLSTLSQLVNRLQANAAIKAGEDAIGKEPLTPSDQLKAELIKRELLKDFES
jgi:hypothetical protein